MIGHISEEYLSIALGNISKKLGLSEALTGVTLLAYANGSPDIISSMVAGGEEGGALLSIGALYGASLFTCNFVCASVLHNTTEEEKVTLPKTLFTRDITVFFTATTLLILLGFTGISTIFVSLILFGIYALYVCLVGYDEYRHNRSPHIQPDSIKTEDNNAIGEEINSPTKSDDHNSGSKPVDMANDVNTFEQLNPEEGSGKHLEGKGLARFFKGQKHKITEKCKEGNWIDKFYFPFEYPIEIAVGLSTPPGERREYTVVFGCIYPFTMLYAWLICTQQSFLPTVSIFGQEVMVVIAALPIQVALAVLIYFKTKDGHPGIPSIMMLVCGVMAVVWIYLVANFVMDILNFIQAVSGVSKVVLGLTLLSLGNSLGDFFVDTALAKQGFTTMAFTGIFSGQCLNLLIGFAMNSLMSYIKSKKDGTSTAFKLFDSNLFSDKSQFLCFFVMCYSSIRLFSYIMIGLKNKYSFYKFHKFIGLTIYAVFVITFLIIEFFAFKNSDDN